MKVFLITCLVWTVVCAADSLHVFSAGDTARAEQVNDNFELLLDRIATLESKSDSLGLLVASLAGSLEQTTAVASETKTKTE